METPQPLRPRPDLHRVVSAEEADRECSIIGRHTGVDCEHCGLRYIVHCLECMQQRSQCSCTLPEMFDRHAVAAQEEEQTKPWQKNKRLWTPGDN